MKKKRQFIFSLVFLFIYLFLVSANGTTDLEKFHYAKKNYITAVFKNDKEKEVKFLKELISYGKKANQDISKYKQELYRIDTTQKTLPKKSSQKVKEKNDKFTTFRVANNAIILKFEEDISKDEIKFYKFFDKEKKQHIYRFDINGKLEEGLENKIAIDGVEDVQISQESENLFRLSIANSIDTKTYYAITNKQLIIKNREENLSFMKNIKLQEENPKDEDIVEDVIPPKNTQSKIVVIDAGHGGKDPGAVGPNGEQEKMVVLNIAKYLSSTLKSFGYTVYLTRDNDSFIELRERTKFANKKNGDIFISIHANAAPKGRIQHAKGIETYFLSPARSERAKNAAALENRADIEAMDSYASQDILLTLLNRSKTIASQKLAIDIQSHMLFESRKRYGKEIVDNGVREGPFWVLVGAQMPSVLVEIGYISHPKESQLLIDATYQQDVARGIAEGITAYFIHNR